MITGRSASASSVAGALDRGAVGGRQRAAGRAARPAPPCSGASMKTTSSGRSRKVGPVGGRSAGGERLVEQLGDLGGVERGLRAARQRAHERHVVDLLQRSLAPAHLGRAAAQHDHRRVVLVRGGDRAHAVGDAGTGGQRADARLARDLRPALGRERRRRLVAHVDQVDALARGSRRRERRGARPRA